jgi:hypothetical protein
VPRTAPCVECVLDGDCLGSANECLAPACTGSVCGFTKPSRPPITSAAAVPPSVFVRCAARRSTARHIRFSRASVTRQPATAVNVSTTTARAPMRETSAPTATSAQARCAPRVPARTTDRTSCDESVSSLTLRRYRRHIPSNPAIGRAARPMNFQSAHDGPGTCGGGMDRPGLAGQCHSCSHSAWGRDGPFLDRIGALDGSLLQAIEKLGETRRQRSSSQPPIAIRGRQRARQPFRPALTWPTVGRPSSWRLASGRKR